MRSGAARIGRALGAIAAFVMAAARGGLTDWAAGALTVGGLVLVAAVLFIPSETPARRLRGLIQAWRNPAAEPESIQRPGPAFRQLTDHSPDLLPTSPVPRSIRGRETQDSPAEAEMLRGLDAGPPASDARPQHLVIQRQTPGSAPSRRIRTVTSQRGHQFSEVARAWPGERAIQDGSEAVITPAATRTSHHPWRAQDPHVDRRRYPAQLSQRTRPEANVTSSAMRPVFGSVSSRAVRTVSPRWTANGVWSPTGATSTCPELSMSFPSGGPDGSTIRHQSEPVVMRRESPWLSISHTSSGPAGASPCRCQDAKTSSSRRPTRVSGCVPDPCNEHSFRFSDSTR